MTGEEPGQYQPATMLSAELLAGVKDGGLVSEAVVLMRVVNADGENEFHSVTSDGITPWDEMGMLEFRLSVLRARLTGDEVCAHLNGHGD